MLNIQTFFKNKPSLHETKQLSDVPLSMQFYDYMYTILRNQIDESKVKLALAELEKTRQFFYRDHPMKSMDKKFKQAEKDVELTEKEKMGMNFLDVFSDAVGDAFENLFKKKKQMETYEKSLTN